MPRQSRIDLPGYLYHIIIRGIERKPIFKDKYDYELFSNKFAEVLADSGGKCFAWVFMPNHVHLLIRSGHTGLAAMMRSLLTGYAIYFNKRYRRSGYLFQNRYKSTLCDSDAYLMALVRYIHLNPLKARLVANVNELDHFFWSGHAVLIGWKEVRWQDIDSVLGLFGDTEIKARAAYRGYISDGVRETGDFEGGGLIRSISHGRGSLIQGKIPDHLKYDERILGEGDFISTIYSKIYKTDDNEENENIAFKDVLSAIADHRGIDKKVICSKNRAYRVEEARKLAVYIGVGRLGLTNTEVGKTFYISPGGITRIMQREKKNFEKLRKKVLRSW